MALSDVASPGHRVCPVTARRVWLAVASFMSGTAEKLAQRLYRYTELYIIAQSAVAYTTRQNDSHMQSFFTKFAAVQLTHD